MHPTGGSAWLHHCRVTQRTVQYRIDRRYEHRITLDQRFGIPSTKVQVVLVDDEDSKSGGRDELV